MSKLAKIDYTKRDYDGARNSLVESIPKITDQWTDRNHSDLGMTLLELFVGVTDMLHYYLDRKAAEGFLSTARERVSVIRSCRAIGYELSRQAAASTMLRFALEEAHGEDITIPRFTSVQTGGTGAIIKFVTWEEGFIPAGDTVAEIPARQGEIKKEDYTGIGQPYQSVRLIDTSIAQLPIEITIDDLEWQEVENFLDSDPGDRHFRIETDENGRVTVMFGDDVQGAIPGDGSEIVIRYLSTDGPDGNIGSGLLVSIADEIRDAADTPLMQGYISVTNYEIASGGSKEESIEEAKRNAPAVLRTLWKMVDVEGIHSLLLAYPGVARAQVVDRNTSSDIARYYRIKAFIAPSGGGDISSPLRSDIETFVLDRKIRPMDIQVVQATYIPVDIGVVIYVRSTHRAGQVRLAVETALSEYFDPDIGQVDFGHGVTVGEIISVISRIDGVNHANVIMEDTTCSDGEILTAGTITVTVGGTV